ncbi:Os06g0549950, partial [Oryza sativa Japonica Group]
WRDALLVPEVVVGVDLRLGHGEPLVVPPEVLLPPHLAGVVAADAAGADHVLAEVQVPVVGVRLPRVLAHERRHERVEVPDPRPLRRAAAASARRAPEVHVLDVVEHAAAVRERRRRLRHAADLPAVRVQDHQPGVGPREPPEDGAPRVPADGLPDVVGGGLVGAGPLALDEHADEQVVGERRRDGLPPRDDVDGALAHGHRDVEHRDGRRHGHELHLPGEHDPEALAGAAAERPEDVAAHGVLVEEPALGVHEDGVDDVVGGEAVLAEQHAEAAAAEVAADADGRTQAGRERDPAAGLPDGVVHLPERRAGVHPRGGGRRVDADGADVDEVEHGERLRPLRPVREALVVVPAAADAEADAVPAAAEHGGLDVGGVRRRDDPDRPRGVRQELRVPDAGVQHRRVRRRALRVQELAGYARREALEEAVRGGHGGR